ncbi:hypothetical protein QJS10_CPA07g00876 [Acorus calamus]|uniref:Uncharacterized protein n=1 Tax=Acorus calamus TaxID=4465 RepID=A0AAV9EFQ8_ACOCL|nr:hypothetical protein QJS10_CPA07g00876 [Acorus calamus]
MRLHRLITSSSSATAAFSFSCPTRSYATTYGGRIVGATSESREISVEVLHPPPDLPHDPGRGGHALPRRDLVCRVSNILRSSSSSDPLLDLSDYLQTLALTLTPAEASEVLKCDSYLPGRLNLVKLGLKPLNLVDPRSIS